MQRGTQKCAISKSYCAFFCMLAPILLGTIIGSHAENGWQVPNCDEIRGPAAVTFVRDEGTITPNKSPAHYLTDDVLNLDANTVLATIDEYILIISTDSGCNWRVLSTLPSGQIDQLQSSADRVYGWGKETLIRLDGSDATALVPPVSSIIGLGLDREFPNRIAIGGPKGQIFVTENAGETWTKRGTSPLISATTALIYSTKFDPNNSHHILIASSEGAFVSNDQADTWQSAAGFPKEGVNVTQIVFSRTKDVVWAMGISSSVSLPGRAIYRSKDGGYSFNIAIPDSSDVPLPNQPIMVPHPRDPNILYFVSSHGDLVEYNSDTNESKKKSVPYNITAISVSPADQPIIYLGISDPRFDQTKIIGGHRANPEDNKWQVALVNSITGAVDPFGGLMCGGAIIAPSWVITAAHCLYDEHLKLYTPEAFFVLFGTAKLIVGAGTPSRVSALFIHKNYNPKSPIQDSDIALLKLQTAADQTAAIPIIDAAQESTDLAEKMRVTGWGATNAAKLGTFSEDLMEINVPLVSTEKCSASDFVTPRMLCADDSGGSDSCSADSGGPMTRERKLIGIVSRSSCGLPHSYGIYTRVSAFSEWITSCMNDPLSCVRLNR